MNDYAAALAAKPWSEIARKSQLPPERDWRIWLLLGGRGSGKTRTSAEWVSREVRSGKAGRVALVGRTEADVRDVMVEGQSGILAVSPAWATPTYEPTKRRLTWPNGAVATMFSADEPNLLRGPQHDLAWVDELAAFEQADDLWANLMFGLRIGQARCVVSTTPRSIPLIVDLVKRDGQDVALTVMTTYENLANLAPEFARDIITRYEGTHLGRQELLAELLLESPGALWTRELIERTRVAEVPPNMLHRVVVAVDPSVSATSEGANECGIVAVGLGRQNPPHVYVLADHSGRMSPGEWARKAVGVYKLLRADRVVAESNQGGALVSDAIHTVDPNVPVTIVHASRSKEARAEPVVALWEQGRGHYVGTFPEQEGQLCSWVPGSGESPDRLDAMVWGVTALLFEDPAPTPKPAAARLSSPFFGRPGVVSGYGTSGFTWGSEERGIYVGRRYR